MSVAGKGAAGAESSGVPAPDSDAQSRRASLFTLGSWLMLPGLLVSFAVGYAVGVMFLSAFGLHEGQLLTSAGLGGRLAAVLVLAIGLLPVIFGVVFARRALRLGAGGGAKAALIVNAVILVYLVAVQVVQQITA
jgi:hypothetical protein